MFYGRGDVLGLDHSSSMTVQTAFNMPTAVEVPSDLQCTASASSSGGFSPISTAEQALKQMVISTSMLCVVFEGLSAVSAAILTMPSLACSTDPLFLSLVWTKLYLQTDHCDCSPCVMPLQFTALAQEPQDLVQTKATSTMTTAVDGLAWVRPVCWWEVACIVWVCCFSH